MKNKLLGFFKLSINNVYILFWGYNIIFLILFSYVLTLFVFKDSIEWTKQASIDVMIPIYLLLLTPIISIGLGLFTSWRKNTDKLFNYFYGVELPIIIFSILRVCSFVEMTPFLWFMISCIFLGIVGCLAILFEIKISSNILKIILLFSQEMMVIISIYFCILALFILIPFILLSIILLIASIFIDIGASNYFENFFFKFLVLIGIVISIILDIYILLWPYFSTRIYWKSFKENLNELMQRCNSAIIRKLSVGFPVIFIALILILTFHGNNDWYLSGLNKIREQKTFEARQPYIKSFMNYEYFVKGALLNNYLSEYNYIADIDSSNDIYSFTNSYLNIFKLFAFPLVYQGSFETARETSAKRYKEIFDNYIEDGERNTIEKTISATNLGQINQASLLNKDIKNVRVIKRIVNIKSKANSPIVKVCIEEEYKNLTDRNQEILYDLTFPEDSAVVSLNLGPELEFKGLIAAKGAARRVYESLLSEQNDPALLEQDGPRQYRLRIFPIPVKDSSIFAGKHQKIRYEYVTFKKNNLIELPQITQKRNVFSDNNSIITYFINNQEETKYENKEPENIQLNSNVNNPLIPVSTLIEDKYITFIPHNNNKINRKNIENKKIALLLDTSYSSKSLNWTKYLNETPLFKKLIKSNQVDAYYFNNELSRKIKIDNENQIDQFNSIVKYGQTDRAKMLQMVPKGYDLAIMLTDGSDYDNFRENEELSDPKFPVYIVHADKVIPVYNNKLALMIIKDGGKVLDSITKAIILYGLTINNDLKLPSDANILSVDSNGTWISSNKPLEGINSTPLENNNIQKLFSSLAAQKLINYLIKDITLPDVSQQEDTSRFSNEVRPIEDDKLTENDKLELKKLDIINNIAEKYSVVTNFSSLIALVNEQQYQQLIDEGGSNSRYSTSEREEEEIISSNPGNAMRNGTMLFFAIPGAMMRPRFTNLTASVGSASIYSNEPVMTASFISSRLETDLNYMSESLPPATNFSNSENNTLSDAPIIDSQVLEKDHFDDNKTKDNNLEPVPPLIPDQCLVLLAILLIMALIFGRKHFKALQTKL